jgi:hypothetical protein
VITLLKQSHPQLKFEVFIRLNRGGIQLNAQEIRNVAFRGPLNDAIYECAEDPLLRSALKIDGPKSAAFQQMQDAEYVLRFLALRQSWGTFTGSLSRTMDAFMLDHRDDKPHQISDFKREFKSAIAYTHELWGDVAFQRWDGQKWRQQALAGLFDAQMIGPLLVSETELKKALGKRAQVVEKTKKLFANPEFEEAVRIGTNTPARLRHRISEIRRMLASIT